MIRNPEDRFSHAVLKKICLWVCIQAILCLYPFSLCWILPNILIQSILDSLFYVLPDSRSNFLNYNVFMSLKFVFI